MRFYHESSQNSVIGMLARRAILWCDFLCSLYHTHGVNAEEEVRVYVCVCVRGQLVVQ